MNNTRSFHMLSLPRISIFFFSAFDKKRGKIWEFILQMDQIPSCHIHSSTRFFIFFQWILKKRDKFCEFIRKWLTNFVKSPQVCNKSYNDLETVLKKKKKKKGTANISGIAIKSQSTTSNFFNGGLGAIERKPTIFKINNWRPKEDFVTQTNNYNFDLSADLTSSRSGEASKIHNFMSMNHNLWPSTI